MATVGAPRGRPQRGNEPRIDPHSRTKVGINFPLDPDDYIKARDAAAAAGISMREYFRQLIRRDVVDETGRPVWANPAPEQLTADSDAA
jgi:hypothetical protein